MRKTGAPTSRRLTAGCTAIFLRLAIARVAHPYQEGTTKTSVQPALSPHEKTTQKSAWFSRGSADRSGRLVGGTNGLVQTGFGHRDSELKNAGYRPRRRSRAPARTPSRKNYWLPDSFRQ